MIPFRRSSSPSIKAPDTHETLSAPMQVRWDLIVAAIALVWVLLDQFTKHLIVAHFSGQHIADIVPVIGTIITFEYFGNKGAAFSSFTNSPGVLAFLILVAVGVIAWLYWSTRARANPWLKVTFGLIFGGAIGNLIDRVRLGYVVDFIHFQLPSLHFDFFVFNVADTGISVGVVMLAIIFWMMPREPVSQDDAAFAPDGPTKTSDLSTKTSDSGRAVSGSSSHALNQASSGLTKPSTSQSKTPTNHVTMSSTTKTTTSTSAKPVTIGASKPPPRNAAAASGRPTVKSKKKRH